MKQSADLKRLLTSIDHKSYPAYKDVRGAYDFNTYILSIDHVQGDPFASPSKVSVQVRHAKAGFPAELFDTPWKKTRWKITCSAVFPVKSVVFLSRQKGLEKVA